MPSQQRARKAEDKAARRQTILEAAWTLFEEKAYADIHMADIAQQAGLAKGTLYFYFKTREHLFLALLEEQFQAWFQTVNGLLAGTQQPLDPQRLAFLLTGTLTNRPRLVRLFAIAHVVLEHNIDPDTAHRYKTQLLDQVQHTGQLLEDKTPFLQHGQGLELLIKIYALVIGVQHLANPAPIVAQVLHDDPALKPFIVRFEALFQPMLLAQISAYQK